MVRQRALLFRTDQKLSVETRVASQGFFQEACLRLKGSVRKTACRSVSTGKITGIPENASMNRKELFLTGFIVKNPHAERKRDDSHPHGAAMNGKFGECVMIGIVQEPGNHAFLGKSQLDRIGGVEFTGCLVALSGKQFGVDLCLEIGMSGKIAFLLFVMVMRHGIDIGMACGVEQIVPQETGDVGFGNAPVCSGRETTVTFQQSVKKARGSVVCARAPRLWRCRA